MLGWERETRRGMLYSGGDSDCIVHKVRLTLETRTRRLEWCQLGRRVLSLHCEDQMNNILTIKCTIVVLLLVVTYRVVLYSGNRSPVLACLWVHFILQVSSILRAEPNSHAFGSAKKAFSFLRITTYSLTRECYVSHAHANIHPSQLRHICLYLFA